MIEGLGLLLGAVVGVAAIVGFGVLRQFMYIGKPSELLVLSGRQYRLPDGRTRGYAARTGFTFAWPLLEKVDRLDLRTIPIELRVTNAYSKGNIPLAVHAIAFVKVASDENVHNAIERFLGRDPDEIRQVAKESLEGHLRGVLARMTPEEVNEDRLKFADELVEEAGDDFDKLGLKLDAMKIQSVHDDVDYLDSIGRERLANIIATAEIAESTAKADAEQAQAEATRAGQVANEQAELVIRQRTNDFRRVKAELEARAKGEEERAEQNARAARARAEQELQQLRAKLEHLRLMSDVVLPADSARNAAQMQARAEAARIAADGEAMNEVLRMMTQTWLEAGDDARDIFLIRQLESVLGTVVERVKALEVDEVVLLDGGEGTALPRHISALPATVAAVLKEFRETTGIDVTAILSEDRRARQIVDTKGGE